MIPAAYAACRAPHTRRHHDVSSLENRLVLVVGAPRSGTTWLQRAVAAHPDVLALPSETHLFSSGISVLRDRVQGGHVGSPSTGSCFMPQEEFTRAARSFCDAALGSYVNRTRPDAPRVLERTPNHVWHLGLIGSVYPDAWVLHIVRDGRDVVRSQVAQSWGPSQIEAAAAMWASAIRSARAAAPGLARYREIRYEELLARPTTIADVFDHLELPALPAAIAQSELESGRGVNVDPTRPDVAAGKWRQEWGTADLAAFDAWAGDALEEAGYTREAIVTSPPSRRQSRRPRRPGLRRALSRPDGESAQRVVDQLLSALASGDADTALSAVDSAVVVLLRDGDTAWRLLGPAGIEALRTYLVSRPSWGEPLKGEQQIAGATWTLVLAHRQLDGIVVERLLQLTISSDLRVREFRLTRFGT